MGQSLTDGYLLIGGSISLKPAWAELGTAQSQLFLFSFHFLSVIFKTTILASQIQNKCKALTWPPILAVWQYTQYWQHQIQWQDRMTRRTGLIQLGRRTVLFRYGTYFYIYRSFIFKVELFHYQSVNNYISITFSGCFFNRHFWAECKLVPL